jgi:hypothetical protein
MSLQPRPTTYRGIQMRSRTEATFAALLDGMDFQWRYEPRAFADASGQYLPDFELSLMRQPPWFVEIKGELDSLGMQRVMRRMEVIHSSIPEAVLVLKVASSGQVAIRRGSKSIWSVWQGAGEAQK